ncbi:aminotransferase class I/II [archaeon]|jgi:aspartate aminotransferase|nr:aminotransferase class I/II [archaeon]MDP6547959.1 aminotransferase class I/II-fold pyridoxal phosphate-dependent enzyme [Candidatus Woesearchaeota archaeon]|tara:strand:+ start:80971 stop:82275 length:1305 start_codon:yes stop_codon:yes gene_type:complete
MANKPELSDYFKARIPSDIRLAQIEFDKREDKSEIIELNTAIGNVSLPMHPAMIDRMNNLSKGDIFKDGIVKYSPTAGIKDAQNAFLNVIAASGFETKNLHSLITDGGSMAMELVILAFCGPAGSGKKPLMLINPAYANYDTMAERVGRKTISVNRNLQENGEYTFPAMEDFDKLMEKEKPAAIVIIPYDNPTGQFVPHKIMAEIGKLCVKHDMWMVSDEAYRELYYTDDKPSSIWALTNKEVPGIEGRRVSIESASKVWNACGLRTGSIVTDNKEFWKKAVAEYTANLCSNVIGQHIFSVLGELDKNSLQEWFTKQRDYYKQRIIDMTEEIKRLVPGIIVSLPEASIYSVVDLRNIKKDFDGRDFVMHCAKEGKVNIGNKDYTFLAAPMEGFYHNLKKNPGKTRMRIAYVLPPKEMDLVPKVFSKLLSEYLDN